AAATTARRTASTFASCPTSWRRPAPSRSAAPPGLPSRQPADGPPLSIGLDLRLVDDAPPALRFRAHQRREALGRTARREKSLLGERLPYPGVFAESVQIRG